MNMTNRKQLLAPRRAGFTLMEMILVLAIISLLLGAGVFTMVGVVEDAKWSRAEADLETLETNLVRYQTMALRFPTTEQGLVSLVNRPSAEPMPRKWTKKMEESALYDPWGNLYHYANPGAKNPTGFDLWSVGPDGTNATEDDIGNWE